MVRQLFIDFKKAYDSVEREVLYSILVEFGIPKKLVRLIEMCLNETYGKVHVGKLLSDDFPIQNGLKTRTCSITIAFQSFFTIHHQESPRKLSQFGTEWDTSALAYADVNLLGDSVNTANENTETFLEASRDIGLEINAEKTKYMIMSHHLNSGQNCIIRIANESFEKVTKFKYVGMTQIRMTFMMKSRVD
jgi:hypothetical protein